VNVIAIKFEELTIVIMSIIKRNRLGASKIVKDVVLIIIIFKKNMHYTVFSTIHYCSSDIKKKSGMQVRDLPVITELS
jgi:hypothetical protein